MNEEKRRPDRAKGNPWLQWGVGVLVLLVLWAMGTPAATRCGRSSAMTEAASNAKQLFYLLVEFDQEFGQFPGDATAILHEGVNGGDIDLRSFKGEYSNDYLAQFIEVGYTKSEDIFYARGGTGNPSKPDNDIGSRDKMLAEGECGFAYVKGLSTTSHTGSPLLCAPMYGDGYKFNTDIYQGKGVILRVDGAVKQYRLNKDRHAVIGRAKTLFQGGKGTVWGEKGFDSERLCYAEKPYQFVPKVVRQGRLGIGVGVGVVLIILLVVWKMRRSKRKRLGWD
jgi:hypothetical protein